MVENLKGANQHEKQQQQSKLISKTANCETHTRSREQPTAVQCREGALEANNLKNLVGDLLLK